MSFLAYPLGWLLRLVSNITPNFAIAVIVFMLIVKLFETVLEYFSHKNSIHKTVLADKMRVLNSMHIKSQDVYRYGYVELHKAAGYQPISSFIYGLVGFILIISLFSVVYHPFQYYFGFNNLQIEALRQTAVACTGDKSYLNASDFKVIDTLISHSNTFLAYYPAAPLSDILNESYGLFGVSFINPVQINSWQIIFPVMFLSYYVYSIVNLIVQYIKCKNRKAKTTGFVFILGFRTMILLSLAGSALFFPFVYFIYAVIFIGLSVLSRNLIKKHFRFYTARFQSDFEEKTDKIFDDIELAIAVDNSKKENVIETTVSEEIKQ